MKRKILILGGRYANPRYANSICRQNLAECLVKEGHDVYILASGYEYHGEEDELNGVWVRKIYGDHFGEILINHGKEEGLVAKMTFRLKQIWHYIAALYLYPSASNREYKQIYNNAKDIIDKYNIDTLVAMYRPFDCIKTALKLKRKYRDRLRVVTYHLDLMSEHANTVSLVVKYKRNRIMKVFNKELEIVDKLLLPGSASYIDNEKVEYVDFPLYVIDNEETRNDDARQFFDTGTINIAIVGSLDSQNRNPKYICDLIEQIAAVNDKNVHLHIWGTTRDLDFNNYQHTTYHGMADVKDVPRILQQSDFLLNIGNKLTARMIPSKIFQMFAAKRPIIFCVSSSHDKSIPYFKRYGYTCFVEEFEHEFNEDIVHVNDFIKENYKKVIDVDDQLFEKSTPKYICAKILGA